MLLSMLALLYFIVVVLNALAAPRSLDSPAIIRNRDMCRKLIASPDSLLQQICYYANSSWLLDAGLMKAKQGVASVILQRENELKSKNYSTVIYIHSYMPQKNIAGYLVLDKLLTAIKLYNLLDEVDALYINCVGNTDSVEQHVTSLLGPVILETGNSSSLPQPNSKVHIITALRGFGRYYEFPTLALLQHHAKLMPPKGKILYMHTKGVTKYKDAVKQYTRELMTHYVLQYHKAIWQCLDAGWEVSGIMLSHNDYKPIYDGNFWWMSSRRAATNEDIMSLVWHWRFGAEKWPIFTTPYCKQHGGNFSTTDAWKNFLGKVSVHAIRNWDHLPVHPPICLNNGGKSPQSSLSPKQFFYFYDPRGVVL